MNARVLQGVWRFCCAVGFGLLLASAFPPMEERSAAWMALVPLLFIAGFSPPFKAFKWGWFGGMVFWLISLSWLLRLAQTGCCLSLAFLGWALLSCYCALYTGAFTMVASSLLEDRASLVRNVGHIAAIPLIWVGFEYLRSVLFTGFPWNALGISQYRNLPVIQIAEWGGVYAVSAVVATMNAALALTAFRFVDVCLKRRPAMMRADLLIGLLVLTLCWSRGLGTVQRLRQGRNEAREIRVAAIQPGIPQLKKYSEEFGSEIYRRLSRLTEMALVGRPDLVIWPETAVPAILSEDSPEPGLFVGELAMSGAPILAGVIEADVAEDGERYYNSSFLFGAEGAVIGKYRKRHLVPFGEYLPFDKKIGIVKNLAPLGYSCTPGATSAVFRLPLPCGARNISEPDRLEPEDRVFFSTLICFEDIFAALARRSVLNGAEFLVNQTNDAWFDGSSAAVQHVSHCVFRCVENRVPAARSANTGVTCFIDVTGEIYDAGADQGEGESETEISRFETSSLFVRKTGAGRTFYTKHGDVPFALPCGVASAFLFVVVLIRERKQNRHCYD